MKAWLLKQIRASSEYTSGKTLRGIQYAVRSAAHAIRNLSGHLFAARTTGA